MNDRIHVYLDAANKWRWRWWRGGNIIADSAQGYVGKRDCLVALCAVTRSEYELTYESRRNATGKAFQQGRLIHPKGDIHVEVTPWGESGP